MCTQLDATYRETIRRMIEEGSSDTIENYSFDHAVFLSALMYDHTHESAKILTGALIPENTEHLKAAFTGMIERIHEHQGQARVVTTRLDSTPVWLQELSNKYKKTFTLVQAREKNPREPVQHLFVLDNKMVRIEEPHEEGTQDVHAKVCFNAPEAALKFGSWFDEVWNQLQADT